MTCTCEPYKPRIIAEDVTHYEQEVLFDTIYAPLCQVNAETDAFADDSDVEMTTDERFVTCTACLRELGFDVAPDTGNVRIAA